MPAQQNAKMTLPFFLLFLILPKIAFSHALLSDPPQRGTLNPRNKLNRGVGVWEDAPIDLRAHFPAGDKDPKPGAGARSQRAAVPFWTPFEPTKPSFRWRAGVCGDQKRAPVQEHMKGRKGRPDGWLYYGGQITRNYSSGATVEFVVNRISNHNGFFEFHLCNLDKCGGEISPKCFVEGHCHRLVRAPTSFCDSGLDQGCAPMDPKYPHRWYLPCSRVPDNHLERIGGKKMQYLLPKGVTCEHCVLHWYWATANTCNPPGMVDFFEGPHKPSGWGDCPGQAGASGGYSRVQKPCGPHRFPEEYYQCADVRVAKRKKRALKSPKPAIVQSPSPIYAVRTESPFPTRTPKPQGMPGPTRTPKPKVLVAELTPSSEPEGEEVPSSSFTPKPRSPFNTSHGKVFQKFVLVREHNGTTERRRLHNHSVTAIESSSHISIEAVTTRKFVRVDFFLNDVFVWTEREQPYFLFGNIGNRVLYWKNPIINRFFRLRVEAEGQSMEAKLMFLK